MLVRRKALEHEEITGPCQGGLETALQTRLPTTPRYICRVAMPLCSSSSSDRDGTGLCVCFREPGVVQSSLDALFMASSHTGSQVRAIRVLAEPRVVAEPEFASARQQTKETQEE